jgi:hypothetical protein
MAIRAILFGTAVGLILTACSSTPSGPGFPKARYDTQYCKNKTCEVTIVDPGCDIFGTCTADLNYYTTILVAGNQEVDVYWNLPDGYGFCPEEGEGVFLKDVDPNPVQQFDKIGATGSEVKLGAKKCKNRFRWLGHNTVQGDFRYRVVFRDAYHVYTIDPWIVNGR